MKHEAPCAGVAVPGDHDLVLYNHPRHDRVRTSGDSVFADLSAIPDDIHFVAVITKHRS
ncbi:hypothetical protein [Streptomyces sp. R35]|uniref:Uncharacterized protein n=1 Tax=Streptomyces sp. R35 TaxID=3238630 RepID=A0AB39SQI1_9ACTN